MSASMYPPAYGLPPAIAVGYPEDLRGTINGASMVGLSDATVAQLRAAISLQQKEVESAANGLPQLCNLLNRRLMEGAGDDAPAMTGPDDPVFNYEANRLMAEQRAIIERTLENYDWNEAIDVALKVAKKAFDAAATGPDNVTQDAWAIIEITRRGKPLIGALQQRRIGTLDATTLDYQLTAHDLFKRKANGSAAARRAAVEAFATEISRPGFEVKLYLQDA